MNCNDAIKNLETMRSKLKGDSRALFDIVFDNAQYTEIDRYAKNGQNEGFIKCAYGTVSCCPVYAFMQDRACGNALTYGDAKKISKLMNLATQNGTPVVGFYDSDGVNLNEGFESINAYGSIMSAASSLSGVVPFVSVILGACIGTAAIAASMSDFIIVLKDSEFYLNNPNVLGDRDGQIGSSSLAIKNGTASLIAQSKEDAANILAKLFEYLPQNNLSPLPANDYSAPDTEISKDSAAAVINGVVDKDSYFELSSEFHSEISCGFARIFGRTVGAISVLLDGEYLSPKAAAKLIRFINFCDSFTIPVVSFSDCRGFLGEKSLELNGDIKVISTLIKTYAETTSPKINLIVGEAIGSGATLFSSANGADCVLALPCARVGLLEPAAAVELFYKEQLAAGQDRKALEEKYIEEQCNPFIAASQGFIDDVVKPDEAHAAIGERLEMLINKRVNKIERKHFNI